MQRLWQTSYSSSTPDYASVFCLSAPLETQGTKFLYGKQSSSTLHVTFKGVFNGNPQVV